MPLRVAASLTEYARQGPPHTPALWESHAPAVPWLFCTASTARDSALESIPALIFGPRLSATPQGMGASGSRRDASVKAAIEPLHGGRRQTSPQSLVEILLGKVRVGSDLMLQHTEISNSGTSDRAIPPTQAAPDLRSPKLNTTLSHTPRFHVPRSCSFLVSETAMPPSHCDDSPRTEGHKLAVPTRSC